VNQVRRVDARRPWASLIAYSRAVRSGPLIEVGGTSSTSADGTVRAPHDPYEQTKIVLETIVSAVEELGGSRENIIRTRAFLTDIEHWEPVGRAHGEVFQGLDPACTFVEVSRLMLDELVVEWEATAWIPA
jgi:enamine deaminase RidA (YjgF/YER057c/UK114 family)